MDDDQEKKRVKGTKKCVVKREITFKNYVDALFNDEVIIRSQQRFRSDHHKVCTEEVNKIALSSNDDKRIPTPDKITTYPYGMKLVDNISENKMLRKGSELLRIEAQKLREESRKCREETDQITAISRKLREESRRRRNEALQFRNTAQPFSVENYQGKTSNDLPLKFNCDNDLDDLSDVDIDIDEITEIKGSIDIDEEIIKIKDNIDNTNTDEEIIKIKDNIDNTDIDEVIIEIKDDEVIKIKDSIDNANTDEEIKDNGNDDDIEETIDERSTYLEMINNQISQVNKFSLVRNMYAKNTRKIGKVMIELWEGNICDDGIYDDPWLKLNELQKMNTLIDEAFDNTWRMIKIEKCTKRLISINIQRLIDIQINIRTLSMVK